MFEFRTTVYIDRVSGVVRTELYCRKVGNKRWKYVDVDIEKVNSMDDAYEIIGRMVDGLLSEFSKNKHKYEHSSEDLVRKIVNMIHSKGINEVEIEVV